MISKYGIYIYIYIYHYVFVYRDVCVREKERKNSQSVKPMISSSKNCFVIYFISIISRVWMIMMMMSREDADPTNFLFSCKLDSNCYILLG